MKIDQETYKKLIEQIGTACDRQGGGEAWGIQRGAVMALQALGIEIDIQKLHQDVVAVENRLFTAREEARNSEG